MVQYLVFAANFTIQRFATKTAFPSYWSNSVSKMHNNPLFFQFVYYNYFVYLRFLCVPLAKHFVSSSSLTNIHLFNKTLSSEIKLPFTSTKDDNLHLCL